MKSYKISVAGTGYVGLSMAVLLSQHNKVTAVEEMISSMKQLSITHIAHIQQVKLLQITLFVHITIPMECQPL